MSSGQYCLIRDLGLVKGGKGLRHHEVVLTVSCAGIARFLLGVARETRWRDAGRGLHWILRASRRLRKKPHAASEGFDQPDITARLIEP